MPGPNKIGGGMETPVPENEEMLEKNEIAPSAGVEMPPSASENKASEIKTELAKQIETAPSGRESKTPEQIKDEKHRRKIDQIIDSLKKIIAVDPEAAKEKFNLTYKQMEKSGYSPENRDYYHDRFSELLNGLEK